VARSIVAVRLANPVALRLHHTPPAQLHPELFLASVASAYQQRHGGAPVIGPDAAPLAAPSAWGPAAGDGWDPTAPSPAPPPERPA
jgi:hypothetical protein